MRRGRIVLLIAPLLSCTTANVTSQTPTQAQYANDANTLLGVSGASVADTAQALTQIYALVGSIPTSNGVTDPPTSLAELQTALQNARDGLQGNQNTLGGAIAGVEDLLGGNGTVYNRGTQVIGAGSIGTTPYAAISAQVTSITAASGLSATATAQAVTALQSTSGVGGTLADVQTTLAGVMTTANANSLTELGTNYTNLHTQTVGLQTDANTLLTLTGTSGTLSDVVTTITNTRDQLETGATTLTAAVTDLSTAIGTTGHFFADTSLFGQIGGVATTLGGSGAVGSRVLALASAMDSSSDDIMTKLTNQIDAVEGGATVLATAIGDVDTALGGSGALADRAAAFSSAIDGTSNNALTKLTTQLAAIESGATVLADAIGDVDTALGGSGAVADRVATLSGAIDSTSNDAISKLTTQLDSLASNATVLADAIGDVDTALGGTGTTTARVGQLSGGIASLLSNAGSATVSDVATLVNNFRTCTGSATMLDAQNILCPAALGGYAAFSCPQGAGGGSSLLVATKTGFTNFTGITSATNASGVVSLVFNDGTAGSTYSVDTSSSGINLGDGSSGTTPIASAGTVSLANNSNSITFVNTSGSPITSAAQLAADLQKTFVGATMVAQNTCTGVAALDAIVGGSGTLSTRLSAIDGQLAASPNNITLDLNNVIASIETPASSLSTAIGDVGTKLGGTGTLAARASAILGAIGASSPVSVAADLATETALVQPSASSLGAAITAATTTLGGSGSGLTANLTTAKSALGSSDVVTGANAVGTFLTATGYSSIASANTATGQLMACSGASTMSAAQTTLCPFGGYAALNCPQGAYGGNYFLVASKSGFTKFKNITGATNTSGVVTLTFNDGTAGQNYTVDTTASGINLGDGTAGTTALATGATVALSKAGNVLTLVNTGSAITSAATLASELHDTFVNATMVAQNTCAGVAALDTLVGGNGNTLLARLTALDGNIVASPTNITADLATAIGNVEASATTLAGAITDVGTKLGGSGTLAARSTGISTAIGAASPVDITTDLATEAALVQPSAASLGAAITVASTTLGGSGSSLTANLTTAKSALGSSDVVTGANAVGTFLTATGYSSIASANTGTAQLMTCSGASTMSAAQTTLCPFGGYAALSCPQGAYGGNDFLVASKSGFTKFKSITGATNSSGIVTLTFNDGTAGQNYTVDTTASGINLGDGTSGTSPIATGGTVALTKASNVLTLVNTGSPITSAAALASELHDTFVGATMVAQNTCTGIAALDTLVGGNGNTLFARLTALDGNLAASPTNITADLAAAIGNVEASATSLPTAISDVSTTLGGSGTLAARATSLLTAVGASSPTNVTADLASATSRVQTSASGLVNAISTVAANLGGSGTLASRATSILTTIGVSTPTNVTADLASSVTRIDASQTVLSTAITNVLALISPSATFASSPSATQCNQAPMAPMLGHDAVGACVNPLAVTGVMPNRGSVVGGASVTITGLGLANVRGVYFGDAAATWFEVNDDASISAVAPAGSNGLVDVTVVTPTATSEVTVGGQFTYR